MAVRVNIRVSDNDYVLIKETSAKMGITMSQFGGMCLHTGLNHILAVVDPQKVLDPVFIAKVQVEREKMGGDETIGK